jgi:5-(carboxyamino)imidazole ribonucleotide mutase
MGVGVQINVGVILSTRSDWRVMRHITETFASIRIAHECRILPIHRKPVMLKNYAMQAMQKGAEIIVAGVKDIDLVNQSMPIRMPLPVMLVSTGKQPQKVDNVTLKMLLRSSCQEVDAEPVDYYDARWPALIVANMIGKNQPPIGDANVRYTAIRSDVGVMPLCEQIGN